MKNIFIIYMIAMLVASCRKEEDPPMPAPPPASTAIAHGLRMDHHVDGSPLLFDTLMYMNEAGHLFSITRLEYYISDLQLQREGEDHLIPGPYYINARNNVNIDL